MSSCPFSTLYDLVLLLSLLHGFVTVFLSHNTNLCLQWPENCGRSSLKSRFIRWTDRSETGTSSSFAFGSHSFMKSVKVEERSGHDKQTTKFRPMKHNHLSNFSGVFTSQWCGKCCWNLYQPEYRFHFFYYYLILYIYIYS